MPDRRSRAVAPLVALAVLAAIVAPATAGEPRQRVIAPPKAQPTRVVPYAPGRRISVNTDLLSTSGYAAWAIDEFLVAYTPLPRLGVDFVRAERRYGVNARSLLAIAMHESSFGTSWLAHEKRNLFGFNAYDRDPIGLATSFRTYAAGIDFVARFLRDEYLSVDGCCWGRFPTLRAVNLSYATDPHWADGVAWHANNIDAKIETLRERGIRFTRVDLPASFAAGARAAVGMRWAARPGRELPPRLRFSVRWTPIAVVESDAAPDGRIGQPGWLPVGRRDAEQSVSLHVTAPTAPGLWRLEIDPRDEDWTELPATDHPRVASAIVRVVAKDEALLGLTATPDGRLVASVRAAGRAPVRAVGPDGAASTLQTWSLPLDAVGPAELIATTRLASDVAPGHVLEADVPGPATSSILVVRLVGPAAARAVPAVSLVSRTADGRWVVMRLGVVDPRTARLLGVATPGPSPLDVVDGSEAGTLVVRLGTDLASRLALPLAAPGGDQSQPPGAVSKVVVRTFAAIGSADPTVAALDLPSSASGAIELPLTGIPLGVRLVIVTLVPDRTSPALPGLPLWAGWLAVGAPVAPESPRAPSSRSH